MNKFTNLNGFIDKDLYYYTGSIQGIYLDKLEVDWKDRIENNKLIYDVLRDEIIKNNLNNNISVEDIKNKYTYDSFKEEAEIVVNILKENS